MNSTRKSRACLISTPLNGGASVSGPALCVSVASICSRRTLIRGPRSPNPRAPSQGSVEAVKPPLETLSASISKTFSRDGARG